MSKPIEFYRLRQDTLYKLAQGGIVTLKAGETCGYFGHSDTYLFQARDNEIPFYSRLVVEALVDWFEPVEPEAPHYWPDEQQTEAEARRVNRKYLGE